MFFVLATSTACAEWEQNEVEVNSVYEVGPEVVHVTKEITFTNKDANTRYWQGFYSSLNYPLFQDHSNLSSYDDSSEVRLKRAENGGNYYMFAFNENVWYGDSYTFTLEYDVQTDPIYATFTIGEQSDSGNVKLIVPDNYEACLADVSYAKENLNDRVVYTFGNESFQEFPLRIDCVKTVDRVVASEVISLGGRNVNISVEYRKGNDEWAQEVLDKTVTYLPLLEDVWGVPFPGNSDLIIRESSVAETKGYHGFNYGNGTISLLHSAGDRVLIHELSHSWTHACNFEQLWMHEGYANLYTFLVLKQINPKKALAMKSELEEDYDKKEQHFAQALDGWSIPDEYSTSGSEMIGYGYSKSFVFVSDIYEKVGFERMQIANRKLLASGNVDTSDHISIIESISGKDFDQMYSNFV
ncbi:M1 aminopeptidase family protein [Methanohalophilus halophilus]|uniref:M1 family metallopeptidase n=1 Tax=Methanohalophilus halophilus TaxID=2177 RepID=UPI00117E5CA5|nr:M1 family metallopeptidase [Methanohalophilus halophilus]